MVSVEGSRTALTPGYRQRAARPVHGVSFVICTHNGAARIVDTLTHLVAQRIPAGICAEVILVDNASEDGTANLALQCWPRSSPIPLRVVHEPRLGLSYARVRGLTEAGGDLISFVDDDNWLDDDWTTAVIQVMNDHPEAGACGGVARAVCEIPPPWWFERFKSGFAVGPDLSVAADVTEEPSLLWGAGLTIRKSAWLELCKREFDFLLPGRQGQALTEGEDTELCCALRLAGWRLRFDPRLRLRHFLPQDRVRWSHLRARHRAGGISSVGLDPYYFAWRQSRNHARVPALDRLRSNWKWQAVSEAAWLLSRRSPGLVLWSLRGLEGKRCVLSAEYSLGRLKKLCQMREVYDQTVRGVALQFNGAPGSCGPQEYSTSCT